MEIKILKKDSKKGLSFLAGVNRPIAPKHVTKLANSIDNMGIIRPVITAVIDFIDGKDVEYIIDGQHLYTACIRLGLDIPYTEIKIKNAEELVNKIALLNASSKSWTMMDYIQAWKTVNKDYIKLEKLFQIYDMEIGQIADILHHGFASVNPNIYSILKTGKLAIKNEANALIMLDRITEVLKIIPRNDRVSNRTFIAAYTLYAIQSSYNHSKTLVYLEKNKDKFALSTFQPEEFSKLLNKIQ